MCFSFLSYKMYSSYDWQLISACYARYFKSLHLLHWGLSLLIYFLSSDSKTGRTGSVDDVSVTLKICLESNHFSPYTPPPLWPKPLNISYLDNCNSLLTGCSASFLASLQFFTLQLGRSFKILSLIIVTPLPRILQWFSFILGVKMKALTMAYRPVSIWCPVNFLTFSCLLSSCRVASLLFLKHTRPSFTSRILHLLFFLSVVLFPQMWVIFYFCSDVPFSKRFTLTLSSHTPDLTYLPCGAFSFSIVCITISAHCIFYLFSMAISFGFPVLGYKLHISRDTC